MKRFVFVLALLLTLPGFTFAIDQQTHNWGVSQEFEDNHPRAAGQLRLDVKSPLTNEKAGSAGWFTQVTFAKATKDCTEDAKKLLERLWSIQGIANMQFSTYQIIMVKANAWGWVEMRDKVFEVVSDWSAVTSPRLDPATPPEGTTGTD